MHSEAELEAIRQWEASRAIAVQQLAAEMLIPAARMAEFQQPTQTAPAVAEVVPVVTPAVV